MRSLTLKLTLAFVLVSLTGIALVAALVWGITSTEFNQLVIDRGRSDYITAATTYYKTHGSWTGVEDALRSQGLISGPDQGTGGSPPPPPFALLDSGGSVILASGPFHPGDLNPGSPGSQRTAITIDNQVVGYVLSTGRSPNPNPFETRFLQRTNLALVLAAVGAALIAVLLGLFLARTITRPIRELTVASAALAAGRLNQQVQVRSRDELGELTSTFNRMSADLEHSNQLRRQMTADIAHDLRTPLSVIAGYLEGLKDGVVKPTPKRFAAMYDEAVFLQRLIEDLRTLSLADAGELSISHQPIQPAELIERAAVSYQHQADQAQVRLTSTVEPGLPAIQADGERMQQALGNLVSNALRYTPEGGEIQLRACRSGHGVAIEVRDSGSGIGADVLPHIFERFYRGDGSRSGSSSGLGLAITKSIVELQGAAISASSAGQGSGSLFTIQFPVS